MLECDLGSLASVARFAEAFKVGGWCGKSIRFLTFPATAEVSSPAPARPQCRHVPDNASDPTDDDGGWLRGKGANRCCAGPHVVCLSQVAFQTNHLSHFLLTKLLMSNLEVEEATCWHV